MIVLIAASGCTSRRTDASRSKVSDGAAFALALAKGLQERSWCLETVGNKVATFRKDGSLFVRTLALDNQKTVLDQSEYYWRIDSESDKDAIFVSDDETHWNRYPFEITLLNTGEKRISINSESWISCP